MKHENAIQQKSFSFAVRIVRLSKYLVEMKRERVMSKQLLRCGTSIGANVEEAIGANSRKDFEHKIRIAYKETRETHYWLRLLVETGYLDSSQFTSMVTDCEELLKLGGTILNSLKR